MSLVPIFLKGDGHFDPYLQNLNKNFINHLNINV